MSIDTSKMTDLLATAKPLKALQTWRQEFEAPTRKDTTKLRQVAKDFEAVFVNQLLETMDSTIDRDNSLFDGGSAEGTFRSMMNQELAQSMANQRSGSGIGLAESVFQQAFRFLNPDSDDPTTIQTPSKE